MGTRRIILMIALSAMVVMVGCSDKVDTVTPGMCKNTYNQEYQIAEDKGMRRCMKLNTDYQHVYKDRLGVWYTVCMMSSPVKIVQYPVSVKVKYTE